MFKRECGGCGGGAGGGGGGGATILTDFLPSLIRRYFCTGMKFDVSDDVITDFSTLLLVSEIAFIADKTLTALRHIF